MCIGLNKGHDYEKHRLKPIIQGTSKALQQMHVYSICTYKYTSRCVKPEIKAILEENDDFTVVYACCVCVNVA